MTRSCFRPSWDLPLGTRSDTVAGGGGLEAQPLRLCPVCASPQWRPEKPLCAELGHPIPSVPKPFSGPDVTSKSLDPMGRQHSSGCLFSEGFRGSAGLEDSVR